jgi:cytochrome P450
MVELGFGIRLGLMLEPEKRYILELLHMHAKKLGIYEGWPALNDIGLGSAVRNILASWVPMVRRFNKWHHAFTEEAVSRSTEKPAGIFAPLIRGSGKPGTSSFFKRPHEQMVAEGSFVTLTGGDGYALTMSSLLFFLSHHPECQEKLAREVREKLPVDRDEWIHWGPHLQNCHYLRACIDEAMRMVPPASNIPWRESEKDDAIIGRLDESGAPATDGIPIPKGTDVGVSPYTMFRRADIFRDPGKFWPERWLEPEDGGVIEDAEERRRARKACKPFSIGPRNCSGQQVAMMMTFVGMANLMSRYEFRLAPGKESTLTRDYDGRRELEFELHFFTMWKEGPWIQFKERNKR